MSKFYLLVFFSLITGLKSFSQNTFAPIGSEWHYNVFRFDDYNAPYFQKIISTKDTMVQGKNCRQLKEFYELDCDYWRTALYVYDSNNVVYFWDDRFEQFQVMYDLNKGVNESWMVITTHNSGYPLSMDTLIINVDSLSSVITDKNVSLKVIYASTFYPEYSQKLNFTFIEKIGSTFDIISIPSSNYICDGTATESLRCYADTSVGLYSVDTAKPCDYTTGIKEIPLSNIKLFPNPTSGQVQIVSPDEVISSIELRSVAGQLLKQQMFQPAMKVDLGDLPAGIYFLSVSTQDDRVAHFKIVKQ